MRVDVRRYCQSCIICASKKGPSQAQRPLLSPIPAGGPFSMVGVDVLQPPTSYNGNQYAVVFMNIMPNGQKYSLLVQSAETIARLLVDQIITRHGVPEKLLLDHGEIFCQN